MVASDIPAANGQRERDVYVCSERVTKYNTVQIIVIYTTLSSHNIKT